MPAIICVPRLSPEGAATGRSYKHTYSPNQLNLVPAFHIRQALYIKTITGNIAMPSLQIRRLNFDQPIDQILITEKVSILQILRQMQKAGSSLIVRHSKYVELTTTIVEIDSKRNRFFIDLSNDPDTNSQLLKSEGISIHGKLDDIEIHFAVDKLIKNTEHGLATFEAATPLFMYRIQYRNSYRARLLNPVLLNCKIHLYANKLIELPIINISMTGLAVLVRADQFQNSWQVGHIFDDCTIQAKELACDHFSIVMQNTTNLSNRFERTLNRRIGCKFVNISGHFEKQLQKYIYSLEHESKRKRWGFYF